MQMDKHYDQVRYNELSDSAEIHRVRGGEIEIKKWDDTDEAKSRNYIESTYGMYSREKHSDALRMLFDERKYNPIIEASSRA